MPNPKEQLIASVALFFPSTTFYSALPLSFHPCWVIMGNAHTPMGRVRVQSCLWQPLRWGHLPAQSPTTLGKLLAFMGREAQGVDSHLSSVCIISRKLKAGSCFKARSKVIILGAIWRRIIFILSGFFQQFVF